MSIIKNIVIIISKYAHTPTYAILKQMIYGTVIAKYIIKAIQTISHDNLNVDSG